MSFKRWLTSVLCSCILLSSILVVPASASDDDSYYSFPAVSDGPALVAPASLGGVMLASATSWDTNDRATLQGIYKFIQYMTTAPSSYSDGSVIGLLHRILNNGGSSGSVPNADTNFRLYRNGTGTNGLLFDIFTKIGDVLPQGYGTNALSWLSSINSNVMKADTSGLATENTLSSFEHYFSSFGYLNQEFPASSKSSIGDYFSKMFGFTSNYFGSNSTPAFAYPIWVNKLDGSGATPERWMSWSSFISLLSDTLFLDGYMNSGVGGGRTLYGRISQLQEVLASDEDLAMREDQKENVDQVKKDFITGQSGKTSLGKDDFGSLSSVGGTFKDTISLNGQSSLADLTSGLSDADTAGQGWFSQATKDSLDAVSGSGSSESTVSTFSDDGLTSVDVDPDPYHMEGFEDNYAWLWGDD